MADLQCRTELNTLSISLDPPLPFGQFLFGTWMFSRFCIEGNEGCNFQCYPCALPSTVVSSVHIWTCWIWSDENISMDSCSQSSQGQVRCVPSSRAFTLQSSYFSQPFQFLLSVKGLIFISGWSTVSFSKETESKGNTSEKVMALTAVIKM